MSLNTNHGYYVVITINLYLYISVVVPPLFVIEFLHRVMDIFEDYFTECNESTIKENYVIVYEVSVYLQLPKDIWQ